MKHRPEGYWETLGHEPDHAIARRYGLARQTVMKDRRSRSMAPYCPARSSAGPCPPEAVEMLRAGQSQQTVAARFAISTSVVMRWAREIGLPFRPRRVWQSAWNPMLGTMTDVEVARRTGASNQTVAQRRRRLARAAHGHAPPRPRPPDLSVAVLRTERRTVLMARYRVGEAVVDRWRHEAGLLRRRPSRAESLAIGRSYRLAAVAGMLAVAANGAGSIADIARVLGLTCERARQLVVECKERVTERADTALREGGP